MGNLFSFVWQIRCGLAFQFSDFEISDRNSYYSVMDEKTSQKYPWTGEWLGPDAIAEYLNGYGGDFASEIVELGDSELTWGGTSFGTCEASLVQPVRVKTKPPYSVAETCIDFVGANLIRFELTNGLIFPDVYITNWNIWTAEDFAFQLFNPLLETTATTQYVCDVLMDSCGGEPGINNTDDCMVQFDSLPAFDDSYWMDGNSRSCRVLHAAYARNNTYHCPHVSFAADADEKGLIKCSNSQSKSADDVFTQDQIATFKSMTLPYESSNPYIAVYPDGNCPAL